MRFFKKRVRLDDPDDNRKHYSGGKRLFVRAVIALLILLAVLVYMFLPVWTYAFFVPLLTVAYVWRPKEPDEEGRVRRYLSRIPPGERFPREGLYRRLGIPAASLAAASRRFPQWCGEGKEILEAEEMHRLVLCWYYGIVKQREDGDVLRILKREGGQE